jgi:hypothetical protein
MEWVSDAIDGRYDVFVAFKYDARTKTEASHVFEAAHNVILEDGALIIKMPAAVRDAKTGDKILKVYPDYLVYPLDTIQGITLEEVFPYRTPAPPLGKQGKKGKKGKKK